jgi:hypothetical protein
MNESAIVTLAIGEPYFSNWNTYCAANWRAYAERHGFDLIVLTEPLDLSPRAAARSTSWQKCLVLSQAFAARYRQIVLLDSDIAINANIAPPVTDNVPLERIGGVISGSHLHEDLRVVFLSHIRGKTYPYQRGLAHWDDDQQSYYRLYGFPPPAEGIVQGGVLVTSPEHHRDLFLQVYQAQYEQSHRTFEQIPLSFEILRHNLFHPLDTRFNSVFFETMLVFYPHLANKAHPDFETHAKYATRIQFFNNFFLHFALAPEFMRFLFDDVGTDQSPG